MLPPEQEVRIIYVKFPEDLLEALRSDRSGKAILNLDPHKEGSNPGEEIRIGEKCWKFEYKAENDLDCISKDSRQYGIYNTLGTIKSKLTVKGSLTGKVKDKMKKRSEESVQQKKARYCACRDAQG